MTQVGLHFHPYGVGAATILTSGSPRSHGLFKVRKSLETPIGIRCSLKDDESNSTFLEQWKRTREQVESERISLQYVKEDDVSTMEQRFESMLSASEDDRRRVEKVVLIDRAAAALAAVRSLLEEDILSEAAKRTIPDPVKNYGPIKGPSVSVSKMKRINRPRGGSTAPAARNNASPGPDFWSWIPPAETQTEPALSLQRSAPSRSVLPYATKEIEKELWLPLESSAAVPSLPPLQSILEEEAGNGHDYMAGNAMPAGIVDQVAQSEGTRDAAEEEGLNPDGSRYWRWSGTEDRDNGVSVAWHATRGSSLDGTVEWEEKWWEGSDEFGYKELAAEKSGRNASGDVWREAWKEATWQDVHTGVVHIEKSADKWGQNVDSEWRESWWEHYDAKGVAQKKAHKWCQLKDKDKALDDGHAHSWHEKWGEEYDGKGGVAKYTDKWADRHDGFDRWSKWGDKWDERFDESGAGRKGGETWREDADGNRWNRTWGEEYDRSGGVHKYGASSSGEHWDSREAAAVEDKPAKKPSFGFKECLLASARLIQVGLKKLKKGKGKDMLK